MDIVPPPLGIISVRTDIMSQSNPGFKGRMTSANQCLY